MEPFILYLTTTAQIKSISKHQTAQVFNFISIDGLLTPLKWFLIVITVFGGAGVLAFVVRWCMRRRRSRIDFEMTQFQHAER